MPVATEKVALIRIRRERVWFRLQDAMSWALTSNQILLCNMAPLEQLNAYLESNSYLGSSTGATLEDYRQWKDITAASLNHQAVIWALSKDLH